MKKTLKLFALAALFAAVFSCTKEADTQNNNDKSETTEEESGQPRTPAGQESSNCLLSFGADIVSPFDTKAVIDLENKTVSFEAETDKVLVVNGADNKTYFYNGSSFVAESEPVSLEGTIYAYYPASAYSVDAEGNVTFTMPEYLGSLEDIGDKAPMAGVIAKDEDGDDYKASFKNVASILEVGITGNRQLSSVVLTANQTIGNGSAFSIGWNGEDPTMDFGEGATKSVTVNTNAQLYDTKPTKFYFIVPAGVDLTGVNVNANLKSADAGGFKYFYLDRGDWNATRNKIYKMSFYAGLFSGGAGTEGDPYKIANARDFKYISKYCAPRESMGGYGSLEPSHFLGAHYQQTADISFGTAEKKGDLSSYMIGVQTSVDVRFSGVYDGQNYKLQNFSLSGKAVNTGLWKAAYNAKLMNIHVDNAEVTSTAGYVGAIVANQAGDECLLHNCKATNTTVSGTEKVGGICGRSRGTVSNCTFGADGQTVSVSGTTEVGGILGNHSGSGDVSGCVNYGSVNCSDVRGGGIIGVVNNVSIKVSDCTNHGTVGNAKNYKGGVIGSYYSKTENSTLTITNAVNHGTVAGQSGVGGIIGGTDNADGQVNVNMVIDGTTLNDGNVTGTNNNVGGIIGYPFNTTLTIGGTTCTNKANVTGNQYVGGIVGQIVVDGTISSCTNSGAVEAKITNANAHAGGIVGMVNKTEGISSCTNTGDVTAQKPHIGGIIGLLKAGTVDRCMNTAKVYGHISNSSNVGGIVGCIEGGVGVIKRCYNSKTAQCKGSNRVGGIVGNINHEGTQVVNCATYGQVIGGGDGSNFCAGGIVGQCSTSALIANCLVRDHTQMVVATHTNSTNKYLMGYLVGYVAGGATFQNCFIAGVSHHIQDKTTHAGSGGTVNANSSYSGKALSAGNKKTKSLTCGKAVDAAFFKDIYVRGNSSCGGVWKPDGNNWTYKNVKWVSTAYNTNYTWNSYVQSNVTLSDDATTFAAKTKYPHEILTAGSSLITGYTASDGESMEWSGVTAGTRGNYPVPTALVELFDGKVSED